jgi:hypothetical protein
VSFSNKKYPDLEKLFSFWFGSQNPKYVMIVVGFQSMSFRSIKINQRSIDPLAVKTIMKVKTYFCCVLAE